MMGQHDHRNQLAQRMERLEQEFTNQRHQLAFYTWLSRFGLLAAVLVAGIAATLTFVSAHGGDASKVHSCVNNNTGAIRITAASTTAGGSGQSAACTSVESTVDWALYGATGPSGPSGPSGPGGAASASIIGGGSGGDSLPGTAGPGLNFGYLKLFNEFGAKNKFPINGTASNFIGVGGGTSGSVDFTLLKNFAATGIGCTIPTGSDSCTDTVHSVAFAVGDVAEVLVVNHNTNSVLVGWTAKFVPGP